MRLRMSRTKKKGCNKILRICRTQGVACVNATLGDFKMEAEKIGKLFQLPLSLCALGAHAYFT